jgi:hypothetical protein
LDLENDASSRQAYAKQISDYFAWVKQLQQKRCALLCQSIGTCAASAGCACCHQLDTCMIAPWRLPGAIANTCACALVQIQLAAAAAAGGRTGQRAGHAWGTRSHAQSAGSNAGAAAEAAGAAHGLCMTTNSTAAAEACCGASGPKTQVH